jgi:glycosyltransferase involved in cell wall biosynthesis
MKRVLHISANQFPPLTIEHPTKKIWKELSIAFEAYHVLARSKTNKSCYSKENNIHLHLLPKIGNRNRSFFISGLSLFWLIPRYKIDGLLVQSAIFGGIYALLASKLFRIPYMVEIHGEEYFRILAKEKIWHIPLSLMIRAVYKHAHKIRSLNSKMTEKLAAFSFVDNVVEIPNRVDLSLFNERKKDFAIGDTIHLVSVGSFVPAKNYEKLIIMLCRSELNFKLSLIGGGKLKPDYLKLIDSLGAGNRVELTDRLDQKTMAKRIIEADFYIQYSVSEGMPRSILEAMALQMPIISSNAGSIAGIIKSGENGLLTTVNDAQAFILAIKELAKDPESRERIAKAAFIDVKKNYSWETVFHTYRSELTEMNYENS